MTDYRRIDPDGLVGQARALEQLAAELATTAQRVDGTLASVGRGSATAPIADAAQWMNRWASTMSGKAAIAAEAVSLPSGPAGMPGGGAGAPAAGARVALRTARVPRWIERPALAVQDVTRSVTRAVAQTVLVQEVRTATERVLERVPVWETVTRYREVLTSYTEWQAVQVTRYVPQQYTVYAIEYRQILQYVTELVPVVRNVTHILWNGVEYTAYTMPAVVYQQVSRPRYVTIPVSVPRTVTRWAKQVVTEYVPVKKWRSVLEPYEVTVQSFIDRWVTRTVEQVVTLPRRVVANVTAPSAISQATVGSRGGWIWDERQIIEEVGGERSSSIAWSSDGLPRPPVPPHPDPVRPPDWSTPMREEEGRAIADALNVPLSPAMLAALVATVNAQTAPIYANGRALNADERFVAALEAARQGTPQGVTAAAALLAGEHPDGAYAAGEHVFNETVSRPIEELVRAYLSDPYNQASLTQTAGVVAGRLMGGWPGALVLALSLISGTVVKLHLNAEAWRDNELSLCEAKARNLIEGLSAAAPGGGVEKYLAKAAAKAYSELACGSPDAR